MNIDEIDCLPEWYWKKGLHDAVIVGISFHKLEYDYTLKNPDRNYLSVQLDSQNALFETQIKEIRFINAKFPDDIEETIGYWWLDDKLSYGKRFSLRINIMSIKDKKTVTIEFDRAETE